MTTFGAWLTEQSDREDETGEIAKIFVEGGKAGQRGKINSPSGVQKWFDAMDEAEPDSPPRYGPMCARAGREYRERRGDLRVAAQDPAGAAVLEAKLDEILARLVRIELHLGIVMELETAVAVPTMQEDREPQLSPAGQDPLRRLSPEEALAATTRDLLSRSSVGRQVSAAMQGLADELVQEAVNDRPLRHADFGYLYRVADFTEGEASGG